MKKWIFSLALTFCVSLPNADLQMMKDHDHDVISQKFLSNENDYVAPYTVQADHLSVKAMKIEGFDGEGLAKLKLAFKVLEQVVNTEEFKDRIINFKNSKGLREFASNNELSNEQIYAIFMDGRETLQQNTPSEMNFYLKLYNRPWSKVIGYTSGDTNQINLNWKYFKNFTPSQVASNLAHEWTHKIGFDHKSAKEHDSAPYAIGRIVGEMSTKILNSKQLH